MAQQSFKVTFNGETRRVPASIASDPRDFNSFHAALTALFPVSNRVVVQYKDEDGDDVTVRSSVELSEAFVTLPGPCRTFALREDTWISDNQAVLRTGQGEAPVCVAAPPAAPECADAPPVCGPPAKPPQPTPVAESSPYEANAPRAVGKPQRPKEALEEAEKLSAAGRLLEARDVLVRTTELHPHVPLVWVRLTIAQALLGKRDESLDAFERAAAEGFSNIKLSLSDEGLKSIRGHPRFTTLLLAMVKGKFRKGNLPSDGSSSLGNFIASKVLFFRTTGANPQDVLAFARACLDDSEVDDNSQLFYQSAVTAAACQEGELTVDLVRRAAETGFKQPAKIKNDTAFDFIRHHLEGPMATIFANKKAGEQSARQHAPVPRATASSAGTVPRTGPAFVPSGTAPHAPAAAPPVPIPCQPSKECPQLATLRALGFTGPDHTLIALIRSHNGDINRVVASLIGKA